VTMSPQYFTLTTTNLVMHQTHQDQVFCCEGVYLGSNY
jgi:hypothetical protein